MRVFVLDATGTLFRSYFAIKGMSSPKGESTNAIYGFVRSIKKLLEDFNPSHLVAVFDPVNGRQIRQDLYADYKAHRQTPDDIHYQIQWAKEFCELYGIPHLCVEGFEADDTIASVTRFLEKQGAEVWVCSQDKDLAQLINPRVSMLQVHKNNLKVDETKALELFGVAPQQMRDYLSIVGDSSDNIPGIRGLGPKAAQELLNRFETLEGVYENLDAIPQAKRRQTLIDQKSQAFLSQQLVQLRENVSIPQELDFYTLAIPQASSLHSFYQKLNFKSLIKELPKPAEKQETLDYHIIETSQQLQDLKKLLKAHKEICFDTEANGLHPLGCQLVGIGFSVKEQQAFYLPFNGNLAPEDLQAFCQEVFLDPKLAFFAHNAKYDLHVLCNAKLPLPNLSFDTILASYLLFAHTRSHSLDALALDFFQKEKTSLQSLIGSGKQQISPSEVSIPELGAYCCEDCDYTFRLKSLFEKRLDEEGLSSLLQDLELPLMHLLFRMERTGIYVERSKLQELCCDFEAQLKAVEQDIFALAGGEVFNISSPKQLAEVLFDKLGIHPPKKNKTGYSTDASVMEFLSTYHPICRQILVYRQYEKLLSTYVRALPEEIYPSTGRIHSTFNQSVAATGRLSSQRPNLQNIPIKTQEGRRIREAFMPEKAGQLYLSADYSQIELRILAHMSEDPQLIKAFNEDKDIHAYTASLVFDLPIENVSFEQRLQAKTVNFGILYGQQAFSLSKELGMSVKEASQFIETYFQRYGKVKAFMEKVKQEAEEKRYVRTLILRKREIPDINSSNKMLKQAAQRLAVNTPIQGTAADIIKLAMLAVDEQMKKEKLQSLMLLQIHDELLFEVPEEEVDLLQKLVKEKMEHIFPLKVPLKVNMELGKNWREC